MDKRYRKQVKSSNICGKIVYKKFKIENWVKDFANYIYNYFIEFERFGVILFSLVINRKQRIKF